MNAEDIKARSHYGLNPGKAWSWLWKANKDDDMPLATHYLMAGVARGYPRIDVAEENEVVRLRAVAQCASWFAWSRPQALVYWPHVSGEQDEALADLIWHEIRNTHHSYFWREFVKPKGKNVIGRSYDDHLCIAPLFEGDLDDATDEMLAASRTLILIPDFDMVSTRFYRLMCDKLQSNTQLAVVINAKANSPSKR